MTFPVIFVSAHLFFLGEPVYLIIGAFVYEFNFMLDCVDGKLARLMGAAEGRIFESLSVFAPFFDWE
jgi:phosphatidylglycerophosphate synthase